MVEGLGSVKIARGGTLGELLGERRARVLEGIEGQSLVVLRLHVLVIESLAELDLLLGERKARVLEGIEGQSLVVLRLHVPVLESLAELDLPLGE